MPDLSEKGSCKIFIAGAPQRITHCNCGYLMRTTPHIKKRSIWRYAHADFDTACNLLDELDLDTIIDDSSIENSWSRWKDAFLAIMERCIPKAQVPNRKNLPWLTKEIVRLIRKRNYSYEEV